MENLNVFINCPFDQQYGELFRAIIFAVHDCGYIARSALEGSDASQIRLTKILRTISKCRFGIHDISRTELDAKTGLPRFNMPLELGLFLAAKEFGSDEQSEKVCLILDRQPYRYQKFCSDIAGQDIAAHGGRIDQIVRIVRDFLSDVRPKTLIPGGRTIYRRYVAFGTELPGICRKSKIRKDEPTFNNYTVLVTEWLNSLLKNSSPARIRPGEAQAASLRCAAYDPRAAKTSAE